jgi:imidazolonepropionase-like amidohydrolase
MLICILFINGFLLAVQAEVTVIKAGKVVDPEAVTTKENQIILIEGGKIKAIGPDLKTPKNAKVIDLSRYTVFPGLFDCHTHMCICIPSLRFTEKYRLPTPWGIPMFSQYGNPYLNYTINNTTAFRALQGARNALEMLEAGFTTIRDAGGAGNYGDTALRLAVEQGYIPGPTIINSGRIIAPTGGQHVFGLHPERPDQGEPEYFYADTKGEMRKAIRENILYGAKAIKIIADDQPYIYSADDIRFIKEEAAKSGLKVAAHTMLEAGARNCAEAGIASIEHGFTMSDETLELAKKNNVCLVGTDFTKEYWREYGMSKEESELWAAGLIDRIKRAYKIGVSMAFGSDVIFDVPGKTWGEVCKSIMDSYVRADLPSSYILQAMTVNAAMLLGVEKERGLLKEGLAADLIATPENPLDDIETLKKVMFVMKEGKVYINETN